MNPFARQYELKEYRTKQTGCYIVYCDEYTTRIRPQKKLGHKMDDLLDEMLGTGNRPWLNKAAS